MSKAPVNLSHSSIPAHTAEKDNRKDLDTPLPPSKTFKVQGLKVTVKHEDAGQLEVTELLYDSQESEDVALLIPVFRLVYGKEQYGKIKQHLAKKHGRVSFEHMLNFFMETMEKLNPNS